MQTAQQIIIIAGPTASGKSNLALTLAKELNGVIINADSMQVYKDIPILSAAPTEEEMTHAPHKLYGIYDASYRGNVIEWLTLCKQEITLAREQSKTPIVIGGTGLYIEALTNGASPIPETPEEIREKISQILLEKGLDYLYEELTKVDPTTAARLPAGDTTRIRRALEVYEHTKKPLSYWHTIPLTSEFASTDFLTVYIAPPRELLDVRLRLRFDKMMQNGALKEAERLIARNLPDTLPAMRALGVPELKAFINGQCLLNTAIEQAKLRTRQYAKRQSTWFNNRFHADFKYDACFDEDKNFVDDIKKAYKTLAK